MGQPDAAPTPPPVPVPDWYGTLPGWAKVSIQLGGFGLIAVLFAMNSRDQTAQLREFQTESRLQAREDRQMFREELSAQRTELRRAVDAFDLAVKQVTDEQRRIKRDVQAVKDTSPAFTAPVPRGQP